MWKKVDKNQVAVVKELRDNGYSVMDTSKLGNGRPDFVVGKDGMNLLVELKSEKGKTNKLQDDFKKEWCGSYIVAYSYNEIDNYFNLMKYGL